MIWGHDIAGKISKKEFLKKIKGFKDGDIEITDHALFRLSEKQRKVYKGGVLKDFVLNKSPIEITKQSNGNLAVLYYYEGDRIIKIVLDLRPNKIYIVTFYILNRKQMEDIGKL